MYDMNEPETTHSAAEKMFNEIEQERKEVRRDALLTALTLVGLLTGVTLQFMNVAPVFIYSVFALAYLAGGIPAAIGALQALREKELDIDLLMVLAALAAAGVGEVRDGAILLFLFSLAGTLEGYAMGNTKRAVAALMKLRPDEANILNEDGTTSRVRVESLAIGQLVIVRAGERLPVDGIIKSGEGAIDQSTITGESVPVDKEVGDEVFAGTVNQNAVLTVLVTKTAGQSTIARMIQLVTEAQETNSPSERFSEWFGERYTYVVLFGSITALIVFILIGLPTHDALYKAATLLVVASPCAIVISVPAAVLSAIASAARSGALFKGGAALEDFGSISGIAFDKTGTLTYGKMKVVDVMTLSDKSSSEVLALAAALETHSDHPVAQSILLYAQQNATTIAEVSAVLALPGKGIEGVIAGTKYWAGNRRLMHERSNLLQETDENILRELENDGKTTIIIGSDSEIIGVIAVADTVRDSAAAAIAALRKQGVKKFMVLTGDTNRVAHAIGATLGLGPDEIRGELLPEDKVRLVEELSAHGNIAFVGDGINDAAALVKAQVGVAMGVGGSDVALEAADVALLSDDLTVLARTHALSKQANRIIKQNLSFAIGIMGLMVLITIFGNLPLPLGVIGHEGGTLLVVGNGLRMLFKRT
jgi:Zn2+/Cd2+-exporting ATPase